MTRIRWYGQSAFLLTGEDHRVFIDPFGEVSWLQTRGIEWNYPAITGVEADLLLITHDHRDHNAVDVIGGDPAIIRAAGTHESPIGEVVGIASEHDAAAGTQRGANTIFRFALEDVRIAHLGDFGQPALRPEQRAELGAVDVLFVPVGGGATLSPEDAARLVREVEPRIVVPMHYRTALVNFLEPPDAFLGALGVDVTRPESNELSIEDHLGSELAVVLLEPPHA